MTRKTPEVILIMLEYISKHSTFTISQVEKNAGLNHRTVKKYINMFDELNFFYKNTENKQIIYGLKFPIRKIINLNEELNKN